MKRILPGLTYGALILAYIAACRLVSSPLTLALGVIFGAALHECFYWAQRSRGNT